MAQPVAIHPLEARCWKRWIECLKKGGSEAGNNPIKGCIHFRVHHKVGRARNSEWKMDYRRAQQSGVYLVSNFNYKSSIPSNTDSALCNKATRLTGLMRSQFR